MYWALIYIYTVLPMGLPSATVVVVPIMNVTYIMLTWTYLYMDDSIDHMRYSYNIDT